MKNKKNFYQKGYGGLEMFLGAAVIGLIIYFFFYPLFRQQTPTMNPYACYIDPSESTQSIIDPKDKKEYVLIKPKAPTIRAQVDYHFARQPGEVIIDDKAYPYYIVWIDALSGDVKPAFNKDNTPGRGGAGFSPGEGADDLRFVDVSADSPVLDKAYALMDIYLLKGEPIPQFIQDYCDVELPVLSLVKFEDTYGVALPPIEINTGSASEWNSTPPLPDWKYVLFAYAKKGSKSLEVAAGRSFAPIASRTYTFTSGDKTATYKAAFLINSSTETITLENIDPLAEDADIGYHYTRYELAPNLQLPADLHKKSPSQTDMLQLEGFLPLQIPPWGWWTPECKPAVYLYPKEAMAVNVKVTIKNGFLTYTDPVYPKQGWNVLAKPDGELTYLGENKADSKGKVNYDTGIFPYLYYEGKIKDTSFDKPEEGYVVAYDDLASLYNELLPKLGLNQNESGEFKAYWLKALPYSPYYFIGIIPQEDLNKIEPLDITPQEDTMIRVRLYFEALDETKTVVEPFISTPIRNGFTVVDWGGMVKRDKDHPFTCLQ